MSTRFQTLGVLLISIGILFCAHTSHAQFLKDLQESVKDRAADHITNDAGDATDRAIDRAEHPNLRRKRNRNNGDQNDAQESTSNSNAGNGNAEGSGGSSSAPPSLAAYQHYDFVPGDTIIFSDDFTDDQVGELPAHWQLDYGQGQVNAFSGKNVFMCTTGANGDNATVLEPRMKKKSGYMPAAFTAEFDVYVESGEYDGAGRTGWVGLNFYADPDNPNNPISGYDDLDLGISTLGFYTGDLYSQDNYNLPDNISNDNFVNKWHHVAIAYRDGQMKIYLDQNRIYVIPQVKNTNINKFGIRVSPKCYVTNIRLAAGGGMTMLNKKFTDAKIITHGITFDVDQAVLKPESMGTLNMIDNILKNNPGLRFEIDGHTDNTGQAAHNLTLSQQRADAVKTQLVKMGIDGSRLTTKGFGDTKPISDNSTPDGRANNRRVEFVRM